MRRFWPPWRRWDDVHARHAAEAEKERTMAEKALEQSSRDKAQADRLAAELSALARDHVAEEFAKALRARPRNGHGHAQ